MLMEAKPLAQQPLEPVARDGATGRAHAHGQAQARVAEGIAAHDYEKVGIGRAPTRGVYGVVLVLVGQAPATRKTVRRGLASTRSPGGQTARRLRPFARRRLSTSRPPFVAIRARNPWVRLRCRLLGWKGRFIVGSVCGKTTVPVPAKAHPAARKMGAEGYAVDRLASTAEAANSSSGTEISTAREAVYTRAPSALQTPSTVP